jgi:uncharacterized protein DUF4387
VKSDGKMKELWEFTKLIRSKNAGPFELTFDIMFKDADGFDHVMKSGKLSREAIAKLYKIELGQVQFFVIKQLLTVKISIPRRIFSGDMRDTDVYGGQFHGPLVRMPVESD